MVETVPPVYIEPEPRKPQVVTEHVIDNREYDDIRTFKTEQEAYDFIEKNGGYYSKSWDGTFKVLYVPKEKEK